MFTQRRKKNEKIKTLNEQNRFVFNILSKIKRSSTKDNVTISLGKLE